MIIKYMKHENISIYIRLIFIRNNIVFLYRNGPFWTTKNTVVSLKRRWLFAQVYYVYRLIAMHGTHVCVHIWWHLRPFAAVRALKFWFLAALKPHVLLHVAQVLVTVTALGTYISPVPFLSLLLFCRVLGVPIGPEGVPEAGAVVTL